MLLKLRIKNFAIVDLMEIDCAGGLSVFTGETGAGKSIVVEALRFLLGGRASLEMIRTGTSAAVVEGLFELPNGEYTQEAEDESAENTPVWVRRELPLKGAGRCFVGDQQITRSALQALGEKLGDLCGQHQQQILLDPNRHTEFFDSVVGLDDQVELVAQAWTRLSENIAAERELTATVERRREQRELTRFQIDEIRAANLKPDEDEKLRAEAIVLKNARRLAETAEQALAELSESEETVASSIATLLRSARKMGEIDARWNAFAEQLTLMQESTEDLSRNLNDYRLHLDFDPTRLETVEARLSELFRLKSKYGESCEAVLQRLEQLEKESQASGREEEHLIELVRQRPGLERTLTAHAEQLSKARRAAVTSVDKTLNKLLAKLGMPDAALKIELTPFADGGLAVTADDATLHIRQSGAESVRFTFEANPDEGFKPLDKIASGGELSRLLLAFKSVEIEPSDGGRKRTNGNRHKNGEPPAPLFIFDEIDSGVGGSVAYAVAKQIKNLAQHAQVFLITHLQQMAAVADTHYLISKHTIDGRARVKIDRLEGQDRVREVARMVAGDEVTETTLEVAAEMVNGKKS